VMAEAGVPVKQSWPMLNGEYPESMEFGPDKLWCEPAITMHHVPPSEVSGLWDWEKVTERQNHTIILADVFAQFVAPEITAKPKRISWDNFSKDQTYRSPVSESLSELERHSYESATNCEAACKVDSKCFQYLWKSGEVKTQGSKRRGKVTRDNGQDEEASCSFSTSFKLGKFKADVVKPDSGEQWVSGWDAKKIGEWVKTNTCQQPKWVAVE